MARKERKRIDKPCSDCGTMMYYVDANTRYCDNCREKRRQETEINVASKSKLLRKLSNKKRLCKLCGTSISDRASNAIYCRDCSSMKNALAAAKRAKDLAKSPKPKKKPDKKGWQPTHCRGCTHYRNIFDGNTPKCCKYFDDTNKLRNIPPEMCYKHENTPYERVGR